MSPTLDISSNAVAIHHSTEGPSTSPGDAAASTGDAHSVVSSGTESYIVAARKLLAREVVFDRVGGELSTVSTRHSIQVGENQHVSLDSDMSLTNHSCAPNCEVKIFNNGGGSPGQEPCVSLVVRVAEIPEGEMITIDYNAMEVDISNPFDCLCGATNCRGRITGFSKLAREIQAEYFAESDVGRIGKQPSGAVAPGPPPLTPVVEAWVESQKT